MHTTHIRRTRVRRMVTLAFISALVFVTARPYAGSERAIVADGDSI